MSTPHELDRSAALQQGTREFAGVYERNAYLIGRGFRDKADRVGFRFQQRRQTRIVRGRAARTPRHAERREGRAVEIGLT